MIKLKKNEIINMLLDKDNKEENDTSSKDKKKIKPKS